MRSLQETNVKAMKQANGGTLTQQDIQKLRFEMIKTLKVMLPKEILEFLEETSEDFEGLVQVLVDGAIFLMKSGFFLPEENSEAAGLVAENAVSRSRLLRNSCRPGFLMSAADMYMVRTGEILTEEQLIKKQAQLDPRQTGSFRPTYMAHIRAHYMGKYVADCSGLIVSICRDLGLDHEDYSASSLYYYRCNRKPISEIGRGDLVFKKNSSSGGKYIMWAFIWVLAKVLEAQGTMYGICVNKLRSSWTLAGRLKVLGAAKAEPVEEGMGRATMKWLLKYKNSRLNLRR